MTSSRLHTTRNIPASSLIQWKSSGRLNRGLSWLNAVPLGKLNPTTRPKLHPNSITSEISHRALEHDVCRGMFIKGSLVIANTRWVTDYESELMSPEAVYLWTRQFITSHFLLIHPVISQNRKEAKRSPGRWRISASDEGEDASLFYPCFPSARWIYSNA